MKKLALAILLAAPMVASANTVKVCRVDEAGVDTSDCRMITFRDRGPSKPEVMICKQGGNDGPTCVTRFGIPSWLRKFNAMFGDRTPAKMDRESQAASDYAGG